MNDSRAPARRGGGEAVLATPDELRDRIRQLGRSKPQRDDARLARVREIVVSHMDLDGPLLPILHEVQREFGHIPRESVAEIAEGLNLSRAEVHGVVTYYHHFRDEPAGRHVLEICRAESCRAMGSEQMWRDVCNSYGLPESGGTTADGALTVQPVYCLGLCAQSPSAMLDGRPHARLNSVRLDTLVSGCVTEAA